MKKGMLSLSAACLACAALSAPMAAYSAPAAPAAPTASAPAALEPSTKAPAETTLVPGSAAKAAVQAINAPVPLTGSYRHEKGHYSMLFEDGKCYGFSQSGEKMQVNCFMKGTLLYLQPTAPKGHALIRNAWIAYQVFDDRLVYSHVEDMDNGEALYKNAGPKAILIRQK